MNEMLTVDFQVDDVHSALKMIGPTKAFGEDGIPPSFVNVIGTLLERMCLPFV